eukprot:TRINITY_DN6717_c0_g2_i6.p2 TRINITY_DN6717_c0_g2~~TRINITY_DN6717_c0_g2_i6.p2  ORF type:complete len:269 (+),score=-31.42 TRINITY_DN6717_c0_g2_i6:754-1560(+)
MWKHIQDGLKPRIGDIGKIGDLFTNMSNIQTSKQSKHTILTQVTYNLASLNYEKCTFIYSQFKSMISYYYEQHPSLYSQQQISQTYENYYQKYDQLLPRVTYISLLVIISYYHEQHTSLYSQQQTSQTYDNYYYLTNIYYKTHQVKYLDNKLFSTTLCNFHKRTYQQISHQYIYYLIIIYVDAQSLSRLYLYILISTLTLKIKTIIFYLYISKFISSHNSYQAIIQRQWNGKSQSDSRLDKKRTIKCYLLVNQLQKIPIQQYQQNQKK